MKTNLYQLRTKGYRITPQREEVLKVFSHRPLSVDEIFDLLKKKNISIDLASIYRTVQLFVHNEILQPIEFGDGKKRYELLSEGHHHHLICNMCGTVEDISVKNEHTMLKQISNDSKFEITQHSLEFFGLCKKCQ